ncbi:MAG TPA: hypothetical protein VFR64_10405 [Methylomirabilota bacterium]|jgi:hypothetical protein|nr:hypothetical protein [Methylomirabilota bacterium]
MVTPWRTQAILVIGIVILVLSVLADALGLGRVEGFGWKQALGVVVGIALIGVGYYLRGR